MAATTRSCKDSVIPFSRASKSGGEGGDRTGSRADRTDSDQARIPPPHQHVIPVGFKNKENAEYADRSWRGRTQIDAAGSAGTELLAQRANLQGERPRSAHTS